MNIMAMRWGKLYRGTPAELAIEPAIAALGVPYRTQFPGYLFGFRYFLDFFLPTLGLVIEIDDDSHRRADKMLADEDRTQDLEARGWRVVRCTNEEALEDPRGAVRRMLSEAGMWPVPEVSTPLPACLPRPKKAPKAQKRAAKSAVIRQRRARSKFPPKKED